MMNIDKHARKVVAAYKKSLTAKQRKALNNENYEELQILIEAALGYTAAKALHDTVKDIEKVAKATRKRASSIQTLEK